MVAVFSTVAGLLFGSWVDGASAWTVLGIALAIVAAFAVVLIAYSRLSHRTVKASIG